MPETGIDVRMATADDAGEVVRLAAMMFASMGQDSTEGEDAAGGWRDAGRARFLERIGGDSLATFVVDDPDRPGRLAASAAGSVVERLPAPLNPGGRAGYVQWVCTDPAFRGRGLGRLVMSALLDWYDRLGVGVVELHATAVAEGLYRSLGFDDSGPVALRRRLPVARRRRRPPAI